MKLNTIKEAIKKRGLKQSFVAERLGISKNGMSDLCTNRAQPSIKRLLQIAAIINCDVCELITKENPFVLSKQEEEETTHVEK